MTLPASGAISLAQVAVELGRASNAAITLNETAVRTLAGKPSGAISLSDLYGKSNYKIGLVSTPGFNDYGSSGMFFFSVYNAEPYSAIGLQFWANTSGQPLGGFQALGNCDGSGNFNYAVGISNTDPYWYPVVQTNWFDIYQDGSHLLGSYAVSS